MDSFSYWFNIAEAAFWAAVAVVVLIVRFRRQTWRFFNLPLGSTFLAFSLSDYLEANIGSFWDSWWLLALKAGCLSSIGCHAFKYYKSLK
jgi:hypothetical protein